MTNMDISQEVDTIRFNISKDVFIKPCPFCGGQAEVTGTHPGTDWVECSRCGCSGPTKAKARTNWKTAARMAIKAWNRRR